MSDVVWYVVRDRRGWTCTTNNKQVAWDTYRKLRDDRAVILNWETGRQLWPKQLALEV